MAGTGKELVVEDIFPFALQALDRATLQIGKEGRAVMGDIDNFIGETVVDEGGTALSRECKESGSRSTRNLSD